MKHKNLTRRPVTERIKTFEDACRELGDAHCFVAEYKLLHGRVSSPDLLAYLKLRIVCAALNEGWEPEFTEDEERWYPWHWLCTQSELDDITDEKQRNEIISTDNYKTDCCGLDYSHSECSLSNMSPIISFRLCYRSSELSAYAGRQFIKLYAEFYLIRKTQAVRIITNTPCATLLTE